MTEYVEDKAPSVNGGRVEVMTISTQETASMSSTENICHFIKPNSFTLEVSVEDMFTVTWRLKRASASKGRAKTWTCLGSQLNNPSSKSHDTMHDIVY